MQLTDMRPVYAPSIRWAAFGNTIAVIDQAEYVVDVYEGVSLSLSIRRPIPPMRVTREMAEHAPGVRRGLRIRWPDGECRMTPKEVVDARRFAPYRSRIEDVAVAPDGSIWVRRSVGEGAERATDVFSPRGVYLGTLSSDLPFPSAFTFAGDALVLTGSEFDTPVVVVYEVVRSDPAAVRVP